MTGAARSAAAPGFLARGGISPGLAAVRPSAASRGARLAWSLVGLCGLAAAPRVEAHALGQSYIFLQVLRSGIGGRVEMTLSDLDDAVGLDRDHDGKVSGEELEAKIDASRRYITDVVKVSTKGTYHRLRWTKHEVIPIPLGKYVLFHFILEGITEAPTELEVEAAILFEMNPRHLVFLMVEYNQVTGLVNDTEKISLAFDANRRRRTLDLTVTPGQSQFLPFVRQGVRHFFTGVGHLLFLLALLFHGVPTPRGNHLVPATSFRSAVLYAAKVFALFTVAHSITLGLATLQIVEIPSRWVELIIAASVLVAAVNNIRPFSGVGVWWIVFGFGLFHGFGLAAVLDRLVTPESSPVETVLGFNLGIEIGQVAVLAILVPMLHACRQADFYRRFVVPSASTLIAAVALLWFIERAFGMELMPL